ncbi:MAG: restriction endonuclease subunit S [Synergistaceae bacterium]|nr:restriction endonuclease subunit S [Synergistaceae bacterium]
MGRYRFDEIAINVSEKKKPTAEDQKLYVGLEHLDSGSLVVSRWGSNVPIKGEKLIMRKGDVLLGKRNAYLRRAAIAPHDGIFSAHGMVLRPNEDIVDGRFFPFFISSDYFFDEAVRISVGSLSPTVNWCDLRRLEFDLPPMDEQRKLARVLWAVNDTAEAYRRLLGATDELVRGRFAEMFGNPGEDVYGWGLSTLGKCCEINPKRPKNIDTDCEYSFVAMPSVSEDGVIDASICRPYSEICKGFTYFAENDVLFAKITPCMENGKGGIAVGLKNGVGFGSTEFHVLRPIEGKSNPHWLYTITMFKNFRSNAANVMIGSGGQRRVPATYLSEYKISLPPLDLQQQFADFVHQADKSKSALNRALVAAKSISRKIISDNLR